MSMAANGGVRKERHDTWESRIAKMGCGSVGTVDSEAEMRHDNVKGRKR